MKAIIKYVLNTIGLSFIIVSFAFDCPEIVSKLLYVFGLMFYCSWSYWSCEDEAKQEEHIKKLESYACIYARCKIDDNSEEEDI